MATEPNDDRWALTEKEKHTLRLMVRGHDAKSIARDLGLSVHTINERLRDARRKMAVSSSRQAARLLLEAEGDRPVATTPQSFGDAEIAEDSGGAGDDRTDAPESGAGPTVRRSRIMVGGFLMTFLLGVLALALVPDAATPPARPANREAPDAAIVDAARRWLALVDAGRWEESYRGTGAAFRKLNTVRAWADASERARGPLGDMISREFLSQQFLPAPPLGYQVVKFGTRFANKADAIETVTLDREAGGWRIVGVTID